MLKISTIFSLCIIVLGMGYNVRDMLKGNSFKDRLVNFVAVLLSMPMLYVFIKMLQML